jgi:hydroxypyruvate isomerase
MPRFAANLSMMFQEHGFLDRFAPAAGAGFMGTEFLFPYEHPPEAIAERLQAHRLTQVLFNLPPGDWAGGERGLASLPGREAEFRRGVELAIAYARALGCRTVHGMAGLLPDEAERADRERLYVENLRHAARSCADAGLTLLIEPINSRDMPGYLLNRQEQGRRVIEAVGAANLKLQLDLYHCQIIEGDLARHVREYLPLVGHIQIAGVPDRHEPDLGEVNYRYLFDGLDELGYPGWIGCEYRPRGRTEDGLDWFQPYRRR